MKNKGITLIALIITIIVLLTLAGVSIALVMGDNGILNKAQKAKTSSTIGDVKDSAELIRGEYEVDHDGKGPSARYIIESLIAKGKINADQVKDYGDETSIGIIEIEGTEVEIKGTFSVSDNIFVAIYNDGTLVFSNNLNDIDTSKTIEGPINIKGVVYDDWAPWSIYGTSATIYRAIILNEIHPTSTAFWFGTLYEMQEIVNIENIDTSEVTNMSHMFAFCASLTHLNLNTFDTSKVTDMSNMFNMGDDFGNSQLRTITVSDKWTTASVTNDTNMFYYCDSLMGCMSTYFSSSYVTSSEYARIDTYSQRGYFSPFFYSWIGDNISEHATYNDETEKYVFNDSSIEVYSVNEENENTYIDMDFLDSGFEMVLDSNNIITDIYVPG